MAAAIEIFIVWLFFVGVAWLFIYQADQRKYRSWKDDLDDMEDKD